MSSDRLQNVRDIRSEDLANFQLQSCKILCQNTFKIFIQLRSISGGKAIKFRGDGTSSRAREFGVAVHGGDVTCYRNDTVRTSWYDHAADLFLQIC